VILPPFVPMAVGALALLVLPRRAGHAVGAVAAAVAVWLAATAPAGPSFATDLYGFDVVLLAVDPASRTVGLVFGYVAVANVLYAYGTGASRATTATQLAYMAVGVAAVFVGDWLTLVVAWELLAVCATVLLWRSPGTGRSGYRYAVYHQLGGLLLVAGVLSHYAAAGTFLYEGGIAGGLPRLLATLGVAVNVGVVGVHVWLVDSYPRPHVATSVVLCGFTTKVGVYALYRVLPGSDRIVAYAGALMLLVGVTYAILQTDTRRLLTYHIVSQVGYMVAGIGLATELGEAGAFAHLVNNVLYKGLLFMVAGAILLETGRETLKRLGGLGRAMPYTAAAFAVAALSITGIPGFAGFVSKGMVVDSAEAAGDPLLWWLLLVGGVGTVISFVKFGYYAFVHEPSDQYDGRVGDVSPATILAYALVALPCVVFGLAPELLFAILPAGTASAEVFVASQYEKAAATTVVGVLAFVALRGPLGRVTRVPDLDRLYHPAGARLRDGTVRLLGAVDGRLARAGGRTFDALDGVVRSPDVLSTTRRRAATVGGGVLLVVLSGALALLLLLV
jgi:multicomponent Na+:H+ antiporter subunit D